MRSDQANALLDELRRYDDMSWTHLRRVTRSTPDGSQKTRQFIANLAVYGAQRRARTAFYDGLGLLLLGLDSDSETLMRPHRLSDVVAMLRTELIRDSGYPTLAPPEMEASDAD